MTCAHSHGVPNECGLVQTYLFQAHVILHISVFLSLAECIMKASKTLNIAVRDRSSLTDHC